MLAKLSEALSYTTTKKRLAVFPEYARTATPGGCAKTWSINQRRSSVIRSQSTSGDELSGQLQLSVLAIAAQAIR